MYLYTHIGTYIQHKVPHIPDVMPSYPSKVGETSKTTEVFCSLLTRSKN